MFSNKIFSQYIIGSKNDSTMVTFNFGTDTSQISAAPKFSMMSDSISSILESDEF